MADTNEKILIQVDVDTNQMQKELSDAIRSVSLLKQEQKMLTKEIEAGNDVNGKYAKLLTECNADLEKAQRQVKSQTAVMQAATAAGIAQNASLDEQRQYLNTLQKAYANLTGEQKEMADQEGGLRDQIKELNDSLYEQEHAIGENGRNVGNYTESIQKAIPGVGGLMGKLGEMQKVISGLGTSAPAAFNAVKTSISTATKAAIKFCMTPIGAILMAIVAAVKLLSVGMDKLKEAFAKSDDAGTNLAKFMAAFKPIIDGVSAAFDKLANGIGIVLGKIADFIGGMSDASNEAIKLVESIDNLEEAERQYTENSAKRNRDIAKLRAESKSSEDLDERKKKLEEAIELEKKNLKEQMEIQKEKLRIMEETAKAESDTSDETKNKIAAARAALYNAEKDYYTGVMALEKELTNVEKSRQKEEEDAAKEAEAKRKERAKQRAAAAKAEADALNAERDAIKQREQTDLQNTIDSYKAAMLKELEIKGLTEAEKDSIRQYYAKKQKEAIDAETKARKDKENEEIAAAKELERKKLEEREKARLEFGLDPEKTPEEKELEMLQQAYEQDLLNYEEYEQAKLLINQKYSKSRTKEVDEEVKKATELYKNSVKQTGQATSAALSALSDLLGEYADESEEAAKAQKAFALGAVLVNQAMSVAEGAKGIAAAMAGAAEAAAATGPAAPFTLIAYQAQMVGQVLAVVTSVASTIVQAKSILSQADNAQKFEHGGIVGGTSYTGDRVNIRANSREMVLTQQQQAKLFEIANYGQSGTAYEAMTVAMQSAVAAMPAPVMDYKEFTSFEDNVSTYNELAAI